MTRIKLLLAALLLPLLYPVHLGLPVLRYRLGRLKAARLAGDRGAISIELALAVIVVVGIAGAVLVLVKTLAGNVEKKIPSDVPAAGQ
ncbi:MULTISPECIES: hypothetical protein [Kitasatospora]|uniref:Uncharacterized protein n=2 Tax=Kitasatospora TaxID=2063 RepID=A0ABT1ITW7_9ACTN|nr:hypothetical protein [Kitasatospora paracochleata]MCP2308582.1 hypothetical protein [Kitasatospora paracochleata]